MAHLIIFIAVFFAIILILIVLVQNSKGGGLSANFSSSNQIMGVRKTTDFLEKATWGLAGAIIVLSILSGGIMKNSNTSETQTEVSAPAALPVSNTTSPDVTLPNAKSATPAKQSTKPAQSQQNNKPAFPTKEAK